MISIPASHIDLLEKCQTIKLATNGADGYPQVTAMWFLNDHGTIRASLNTSRQKAKNLLKNPKVTVFLDDPVSPYRTLEIRANAIIEPDPEYQFAGRVGTKYGANLRDLDKPGESRIIVTFEPVKINIHG